MDKRKNNPETPPEDLEESGAAEEAASAPLRQTVFKPPLRETASSAEGSEGSSVDAGFGFSAGASPSDGGASVAAVEAGETEEARDYLDDLKRVQAEFDNFRKRTFRERQSLEARGKRGIVERVLPVLDNFERAIAHGEGGAGVELVFKELKSVLAGEGLSEIEAESKPFDPQVHEAVESVEDPEVDQATVTQVYRRGYTFNGDVVRPAMVVVARPVEGSAGEAEAAGGGV